MLCTEQETKILSEISTFSKFGWIWDLEKTLEILIIKFWLMFCTEQETKLLSGIPTKFGWISYREFWLFRTKWFHEKKIHSKLSSAIVVLVLVVNKALFRNPGFLQIWLNSRTTCAYLRDWSAHFNSFLTSHVPAYMISCHYSRIHMRMMTTLFSNSSETIKDNYNGKNCTNTCMCWWLYVFSDIHRPRSMDDTWCCALFWNMVMMTGLGYNSSGKSAESCRCSTIWIMRLMPLHTW